MKYVSTENTLFVLKLIGDLGSFQFGRFHIISFLNPVLIKGCIPLADFRPSSGYSNAYFVVQIM